MGVVVIAMHLCPGLGHVLVAMRGHGKHSGNVFVNVAACHGVLLGNDAVAHIIARR